MKFLKNNGTFKLKNNSILLLIINIWFLQPIYAQLITTPTQQNEGSDDILIVPSFKGGLCGIEENNLKAYAEDPNLKLAVEGAQRGLLQEVQTYLERKGKFSRSGPPEEIVIPVVFHYLYDECPLSNSGVENTDAQPEVLTNERFQNAIDQLNIDFAAGNIRFRFAEMDENGFPTNGINRIKHGLTHNGLGRSESLGYIAQWDRSKYLNIYVLELVTSADNSGIAYYPETTQYNPDYPDWYLFDRACIARWAFDPANTSDPSYDTFKSYFLNTISHEVGHWLGLRHLWGSGIYSNYCDVDDFDFLSNTDTPLPDDIVINDTPNADLPPSNWWVCNSTPPATCGCTDNCDMDLNIMDYTGCTDQAFTPGQFAYMNAVLNSSISDRNMLQNGNTNQVLYADYDTYNEPITEPRLVFINETTFYEGYANDGSFSNVLDFEMKGQVNSETVEFSSGYLSGLSNPGVTEVELPSQHFHFDPPLPSGLEAKVFLTSSTNARLKIIGNTNTNTDFTSTFILGQFYHPLVPALDIANNRKKSIRFDFIEETGITHTSLNAISPVGPNSTTFKNVVIKSINNIEKDYKLGYVLDDSGNGKFTFGIKQSARHPVELGMNSDGSIKTFALNEVIAAPNFEYDFYPRSTNSPDVVNNAGNILFKEIDFNNEEEFFIALRIRTCEAPYYGWLRLKYDAECNSLIATDYAINNTQLGTGEVFLAGELDEPSILFKSPKITNESVINPNLYNGFEIELLNTQNSLLSFNSSISYNYTVSPNDLGLSKDDIKITRLEDGSTAFVEPDNSREFWKNNSNVNFNFDLNILPQAIDGTTTSLTYSKEINVSLSSQLGRYNNLNSTVYNFNGSNANFFLQKGTFGIQYYDGTTNGLVLYSPFGWNYQFACKPNSFEIQLFDFGQVSNDNLNFKTVQSGDLTNSATSYLEPVADEVFLPESAITNALIGQTKYMIYRFATDCKFFYGWFEITFNADGTYTISGLGVNYTEGDEVYAGIIAPGSSGTCESCHPIIEDKGPANDFWYMINFGYYTPDGICSEKSSNIDYTDHYDDYSNEIFASINTDSDDHLFKIGLGGGLSTIQFDPTEPDSERKGAYAIWIDYNKDDCFEEKELVSGSTFSNITIWEYIDIDDIDFPDNLVGEYKMRVFVGLRFDGQGTDNAGSGCNSRQYGEIEDYKIEFLSGCPDLITYNDEYNLPAGTISAQNIVVDPKDNINTILFPGQKTELLAGKSICIGPNAINNFGSVSIKYGSVFLAHIEECNDGEPICNTNNAKLSKSTFDAFFKIYPNPFSQQSTIEFELFNDSKVNIYVSDITGKKVTTLSKGEQKSKGFHKVTFNAKGLSQGIYYCTLIAGEKAETRKMVITK